MVRFEDLAQEQSFLILRGFRSFVDGFRMGSEYMDRVSSFVVGGATLA